MFGYVHPSRGRLSKSDIELYRSAYCGMCDSLGKLYGIIGRFTLNYDFTFLAMISAKNVKCEEKKCIRHPLKKHKCVCNNYSFDRVAVLSMILSYWQIIDAIHDKSFIKGIKYRLLKVLLKHKYKKAKKIYPDFDATTRNYLEKLSILEDNKCNSIDQVADCFACLLSEASNLFDDINEQRIMKQLLYHLGRWIYIIDAVDDYENDYKTNCYNPIIYRYHYDGEKLTSELKSEIKKTMDASLRSIASSFELLNPNQYHSLLENIVYEGLYLVEDSVLNGSYHKSIKKAQEYGE